ncbi:hypothetical protein [Larsenimonas rhizosphaerae]|uniref:hypothetical protein n=1 Tax=Larsenimonas rhizosphaerae TaxID=2944682 RepID=UPI002034031F|nr:hypothetical protein [Larsenimonas rhizosphaerae]MCM2131435.1 hypothetical protein [Larsenimonas rhizosphaerae]
MGSLALISGTEAKSASPRAGFMALRDELHRRTADLDLIELWASLQPGEHAVLLRSAGERLVPNRPLNEIPLDQRTPEAIAAGLLHTPMERMTPVTRQAIRAAIHRMSTYANRLKDMLETPRPHPSQALAASARTALAEGDTEAVRHFLHLIEHAE